MTSIMIDRTDGLSSAAAIKGPVRAATTANITLYGHQTIDGVAVVTRDRVLVKDQTAGYENGIYVADTGQWRRSKDFNRTNDVVTGTLVSVTDGTISAGLQYGTTAANPISVGTSDITFLLTDSSALTITAMVKPTYDPSGQGTNVYDQKNRNDSPVYYGATGDGTTVDTTAYQAAEAAQTSVFLPQSTVFNLGSSLPVNPVYGGGALKLGTKTLSGFQPNVFAQRGSAYFSPDDPGTSEWLYTEFPADGLGGHANFIFGVGGLAPAINKGSGAAPLVSRTVSFGPNNLQAIVSSNRNDAFGSSVMRWMRYGERNTGNGSLVFQWAGGDLSQDPNGRFYYHDILYNAGVPVTDPAWDANGFETANPGIRATLAAILASNPWATATTDFMRNVGTGRDAGVCLLKGTYNTYEGYRAGAWAFIHNYNTHTGADSGNKNMLGDGNSTHGFEAGFNNQNGSNNSGYGRQSIHDFINNSFNTGLAFRAGWGAFGGDGNLYLGPYSGSHDVAGAHSRRFYLGQSASQAAHQGLMVGDFATGALGFGLGLTFADLAVVDGLLLRKNGAVGGPSVNASARGLIVENGTGSAGITLKTLAAQTAFFVFANDVSNNAAHIKFLGSTGVMTMRVGTDRLNITATGMGFNGTAAIAKPTLVAAATDAATTQTLANDIRTKLIAYGLAA